jgi:Tol biopolymer transport system component
VSFLTEQAIGRASLLEEEIRRVQPFEEAATLINLAVSPDGAKVAFERMGGDLYVMDADGTDLVDLGPGHRPAWSPDGEWVVYMITQDDGERFTASDLYAVRADATQRTQLTDTPDRFEMSPAWSPDGRTIAFEALNEGRVYLLPVAR